MAKKKNKVEATPEVAVEEVAVEAVEEVVEAAPEVVEVKEKKAPSKSGFEKYWNGIGARKIKQEVSPNAIVNAAKEAFGKGFDAAKYIAYRAEKNCSTLKDKVEGVWLSQ